MQPLVLQTLFVGTTNWTAITGEIIALKTNVSVLLSTTNAQQFLQVRQTR